MLDNVGLRYPHRASGTKAPRTLRPLPLLRFAVSATGGAHLCSIQYYLRFWLSSCRTSLAVSALRIMRYYRWFPWSACGAVVGMRAGFASFFPVRRRANWELLPCLHRYSVFLSGSDSSLQTFAIEGKYKFRWSSPRFCGSTRNLMPKIYSCCTDLSICAAYFRVFVQI